MFGAVGDNAEDILFLRNNVVVLILESVRHPRVIDFTVGVSLLIQRIPLIPVVSQYRRRNARYITDILLRPLDVTQHLDTILAFEASQRIIAFQRRKVCFRPNGNWLRRAMP